MRDDDGEIVFEATGDDLVDKWERELAMGLAPDLTEGMSQEAKKRLEQERAKGRQAREAIKELDGLVDSSSLEKFHSVSPRDKQYDQLMSNHRSKSKIDLKKHILGNK